MSGKELTVFGIDLGTTYSAISYVDETGRATICRNSDNQETTPSVVFFENESNVVVGSVAKNSAVTYPDRVVSLIKREMGSRATFEFDGKMYTPESISSLVLKQLANDAEAHSGSTVEKAVITVPAYFGMLEKDATKNAGQIAGLDVIGIVPEPVAAALHYEATTGASGQTILVYDLGGGTFDTTVIRVSSDEITVVCTDGDDRLGGADWDARLRDYLLTRFQQQAPPGTDVEDDEEFLQSLVTTAEDTKKQLSKRESRPVALRGVGVAARIDVTRAEFEELTKDLLDKTIDIVRRTLETLKTKSPGATIDEVLLVGGSTNMPAVAQRLHDEFGWQPKLHDPELAVARGAALFALGRVVHRELAEAGIGSEADADATAADATVAGVVAEMAARTGISADVLQRMASKQTHHVLPKAFGVKLVDTTDPDWEDKPLEHYIEHMVHANDTLPTGNRPLTARTLWDNQRSVQIELFEQSGVVAGPDLAENKPINEGAGTITGLPPLPAGSPLDIVMSVTEEGLLELTATEPTSGNSLRIEVRVSTMTAEQIEEATELVSGLTVTG
jgi:molecular chaperone DnaK (HSP70)